jgi:heat shock protein HslJ
VLELDDLAVTDSPCPPAQAERQDDVLAVLGASPVRLDLAPDSLTLGADGPAGATLLYEPGSPLEGSTWQLTRVAGAELPPDAIVTVRLDGGRLTGIGLCGTFEADYVTNGVRIEMGDVARAPGRCREAQVDDALMAALGSAAFVRRTGGGLSLLDAEGRDRARFRHPGGP